MKKWAIPAALLLALGGLAGCPIYDHADEGCYRDLDCAPGFLCDDATGSCYDELAGIACDRPSDCGENETCSRTGSCEIGDCHFASVGCVRGYVCDAVAGRWACVSESAGQGGDSSGGGPGTAGAPVSGGAPGSDGGTPSASGGEPTESGGMPNQAGGAPAADGGPG
jgi:hypothetical protein